MYDRHADVNGSFSAVCRNAHTLICPVSGQSTAGRRQIIIGVTMRLMEADRCAEEITARGECRMTNHAWYLKRKANGYRFRHSECVVGLEMH